ncbi:hypothetical protein [Catenulispora subtropica]|uniref:Uncharacterized protein n=1 Tax=Catenulispora subtropica TaxID=450798 RepID=A0ABP5CRQ3_9ACTN
MTTKLGVTLLIVGGYVIALGIGGINAASGGTKWLFALLLVIGVVVMGWAMILPWDGGEHAEAGAP